MLSLFRQQPRPFYMIFMLEIWERFGFYTVQGILVLYFIKFLGFSDFDAYQTFGAFFALIYGLVALGGYLGDKVIGTKRTIVLGLVVLATGYLALALVDKQHIFYALGIMCVGNGLFKANPSSLLAECYEKNTAALDSGFTLYYMAINLGSIAALFAGPFISEYYGYSAAFSLSFIGILLGLANYWFQRLTIVNINTQVDKRKIAIWQWGLIILGIGITSILAALLLQHMLIAKTLVCIMAAIFVSIYLASAYKKPKNEQSRMILALILMFEAVLFFTLYQQMPTSINLFAVNNVTPYLFGLHINPQSFQVLNPIWIILMSPVVAMFYTSLEKRNIAFDVPYKFALGMGFCGLSFIVLFISRFAYDSLGMVSSWWLVASYFFQALSELLVSALGLAMVAELVSQRIMGFVMGMWFLTSSLSGFTGAMVASITALPKNLNGGVLSLMIYTGTFAKIGLVTLVIALFLWIISPRLCRLIR